MHTAHMAGKRKSARQEAAGKRNRYSSTAMTAVEGSQVL